MNVRFFLILVLSTVISFNTGYYEADCWKNSWCEEYGRVVCFGSPEN